MDKTPQIITQRMAESKEGHKKEPIYQGEYYDFKKREKRIYTIESLKRIADQMVLDSLNNKDCISFGDLFLKRGILSRTFYKWVAQYPFFNDAYEFACENLSLRREKGALFKKLDISTVTSSMHLYDERWRQAEIWRASLKNKNEEQTHITILKQPLTDTANAALINSQYFKVTESESFALRKSPEEVAGRIKNLRGRVDQGSNLK